MRYGLFIIIFAVLGIGEYAFVEYYPLTPQGRVNKLVQLPIVKQIMLQREYKVVKQAFSADEDGVL